MHIKEVTTPCQFSVRDNILVFIWCFFFCFFFLAPAKSTLHSRMSQLIFIQLEKPSDSLVEVMMSRADGGGRQLIQSWLSRHRHVMTPHWHTERTKEKRFNIEEKDTHTHTHTHTQTNITTKWQMSQSPARQTLLSFICKWVHRPTLAPCSPYSLRTPKRWSQPPIRPDKMSDEVIGSDGTPNDRWQDKTRRSEGEMSWDDGGLRGADMSRK